MWTSFASYKTDVDKGTEGRMRSQVGPRGWKWLGQNEVRWTEGTGMAYKMCLLIQTWSVGVDLAWWKETHRLGIGNKSLDRGTEIGCRGAREGQTRQGH